MQRREFILQTGKIIVYTGILYSFNGLPAKAATLGNKKLSLEDITINNAPDPFNFLPNTENLEYALDVTYTGNENMLYATVSGNDPTKLGVDAIVEN